jgi:hypothetical protein
MRKAAECADLILFSGIFLQEKALVRRSQRSHGIAFFSATSPTGKEEQPDNVKERRRAVAVMIMIG